ncbi:amidohydrolase [Marinihelvus fidelis]|uniref:amidohydrolase n=1 Tax=Marinihelvus fidelis TaxID=2613842 RepID=UPI001CD57503|nr:amidohydrolase [Marinihelvus fidelis]
MKHIKLLIAGLGLASAGVQAAEEAFPSTYEPLPSQPTLITNATILTGTGERLENASILLDGGTIAWVGSGDAPANAVTIDAEGGYVTPGIIDVHSHLGVYPSPGVSSHADGNEMTNPATPNVWAEHSIWPQDPGFSRALAAGVTSLQILPGSGNLIGGRGVTVKNVYSTSYQGMKFPGAPHGMKMACGENPKRVYGQKGRQPMTRMGNVASYREEWISAQAYLESWTEYERKVADGDEDAKAPKRDLKLETLAGALKGDILVNMHCYRADEMLTILDLAKEFGYKVTTFHHGVEAYKIADELAEAGVCGALWADWWGFKMEAYDGIQENIALVDRPEGSCAIVHSDSSEGIQRLNQEAAKAMAHGRRAGLEISEEHAISWLTSNAANSLGVGERTGTLEAGKMADVVVWNGTPFSVYAKAEKVFIDGALLYDRENPALQPVSDFELGQLQEVR